MRWRAKPKPKEGDTRTILRFPWLPVTIGDQRVWLECVKVKQVFARALRISKFGGEVGLHLRWEDLEMETTK